MRSPGGTPGGGGMFLVGFGLSGLAVYLFFWSVMVHTGEGMIGRLAHGITGSAGRFAETTSTAILFLPFLLGVITLFYDARKKWGWWLIYIGIFILAIEILSRIRFAMNMRLVHLLGLIILFAAGTGLMLRSYRDQSVADVNDESP
ncbi:MAG: hypothetical protein R3C05_16680 [Pirellulaceae bacterium]